MKRKSLLISVLLLLAAGCVMGGRSAKTTEYYMLDYAAPVFQDLTRLDDVLKVERFSVSQLYNSTAVVSGTGSFVLSAAPYARWKANPADLVTDALVRDFRRTGLFPAVFSYREPEKTRFALEGTITEFLELKEKGGRKALLGLSVTLLDLNRSEASRRVVFQKNYSRAATCEEEGPGGLARGLSGAMAELSGQIINDVYQAIKTKDKDQY